MIKEIKEEKEKYSVSDLVRGFLFACIPIVAILLYGLISGEINFAGNMPKLNLPALEFEGLTSISFDGIGSSGDLLNVILIAEIILIGLAIPFTILMVFRFVKDLDRQILRLYLNEKIYLAQYWLLILHVVFILLVKFLNINNPFVIALICLWAVLNLIIFALLIKRVHLYSTDIHVILVEKIRILLRNIFSSNKEESLQDLGLILNKLLRSARYGVRQADNNFVNTVLNDLTSLTSTFFLLKEKNYTKYQILMGMDRDEVIDGKLFQGDIWELLKKVPHKSSLLDEFLKIYKGIWEEAILDKNHEITQATIESLIVLLIDLTRKEGNFSPVRKILVLFNEFTIKRFQIGSSKNFSFEESGHLESVGWFNRVISEDESDRLNIDPSYLELLSLHLFKNFKIIENNNQIKVWRKWLNELPTIYFEIQEQIQIRKYVNDFKKFDPGIYNDLDFHGKIENTICKMEEIESAVLNLSEYRNWEKSFAELNVVFEREYALVNWGDIRLKGKKIKENMLKKYISGSILKLLANLGAYLISKGRADFVIEFFENSDFEDIRSENPNPILSNKIVRFVLNYFLDFPDEFFKDKFENEFVAKKNDYKKFFLTLLMLTVNPYSIKSEEKFGALKDLKWVSSKERLKRIDRIILELENTVYELRENDEAFLEDLGISMLKQSEYFEGQLEEIFDFIVSSIGLNRSIEISESRLSPFQVDHFVETFSQTLNSSLIFYNVYDHFHRIQNRFGWEVDPEIKVHVKRVYPKTHFLESSNISIKEVAFDLANFTVREMDFYIANKITEHCEKIKKDQIEDILKKYSQTSPGIIFVFGEKAHDFIKNSNKFFNRWDEKERKVNVAGFIGFYQSDENRIPVFATEISEETGKLLILEEKKMGKLIHYQLEEFKPFIERGERKHHFKLVEFSKNPKLTDTVIREYSDWVSAKCGREHPKIFLNTQVWVEFLAEYNLRFEFDLIGQWCEF